MEFSFVALLVLCLAAFAAGYLDTLVGGGGLITIPALLMAGVPPLAALGTNKLQAVTGSGTASLMMFRLGKVRFREVSSLMAIAFASSLVGTVAVQYISTDALNILIPIVIVIIALYFILAPQQAAESRAPKVSERTYKTTAVPVVGAYDGMFGPGTGSFFVLAGVSLRGQEIVSATARAKTLNFATNLASLLVFLFFGQVVVVAGVVMMLGQVTGARLGATTLVKIDPVLLRYLVIAMCLVMLVSWAVKEL